LFGFYSILAHQKNVRFQLMTL